jgi:hypothetical protein
MTTLAEVVITCGEPVTFKKSVFQAYAAPAKSIMVSVRRGCAFGSVKKTHN